MSHFSDGQLRQTGNALEAADWLPEDLTLLGQAGRDRLVGIRDSLRRGGGIVEAVVEGRTELWLLPEQEVSWVRGRVILTHLTETGLLASCADVAELEAIQAKGIDFFRRYFPGGKAVFGWRGLRNVNVPFLLERGVRVELSWFHLDDVCWCASYPALRRK